MVLSVHDFGLFCSRPHLLERPQMEFCGFCRDDARCTACLRCDGAAEMRSQETRRQLAAELLRRAHAVVYPSAYLRDTYQNLFGELSAERQYVVAPPSVMRASAVANPAPAPRDGRPLRIAYVGSFRPHKGSRVFLELVDRMRSIDNVRWHVLGGGDADALARLRREPAVRVHGYYRSGQLSERLRSLGIDLALVLSIWPETYCMTVDECLRAGRPVLAFGHGAPAERLRRHGGGVLIEPAAGAGGVEAWLRDLLAGRTSLPDVQNAANHLPDAIGAASAFRAIYASIETTNELPE